MTRRYQLRRVLAFWSAVGVPDSTLAAVVKALRHDFVNPDELETALRGEALALGLDPQRDEAQRRHPLSL